MNKLASALLILSLGLAACSSSDTTKEGPTNTSAEKEEKTKEEAEKYNEYGDVVYGTFKHETADKDGFVEVDFEGFKVQIKPILAETYSNEETVELVKGIRLISKAENTRQGDVDYSGTMTIVTDTKEQLHVESGLMSDNPIIQTYIGQVKAEGSSFTALEDQSAIPQKITLIMGEPYEVVDGSVDPTNGVLGKEQRIEFVYEEAKE